MAWRHYHKNSLTDHYEIAAVTIGSNINLQIWLELDNLELFVSRKKDVAWQAVWLMAVQEDIAGFFFSSF